MNHPTIASYLTQARLEDLQRELDRPRLPRDTRRGLVERVSEWVTEWVHEWDVERLRRPRAAVAPVARAEQSTAPSTAQPVGCVA